MTFTIEQKLPSLNDYTYACRSNAYKGNQFKREVEGIIGWYIKKALANKSVQSTKEPCIIVVEWHKKDKRMDVDNIHSSIKFILDAMKKYGIIPDDSRRYVKQIYQTVIDDTEEYCVVKICNTEGVSLVTSQ
jgi:Holliday junction resolvase RusA-like endonuclease